MSSIQKQKDKVIDLSRVSGRFSHPILCTIMLFRLQPERSLFCDCLIRIASKFGQIDVVVIIARDLNEYVRVNVEDHKNIAKGYTYRENKLTGLVSNLILAVFGLTLLLLLLLLLFFRKVEITLQHLAYSFGVRSKEGQRMLEFCAVMEITVGNTFLKKTKRYLATCERSPSRTHIDYCLVRRDQRKFVTT